MSLWKSATTLRRKARSGRITAGAASTSKVSHGGALAVQTITTSAPNVNVVQSVAIVALPVGNSFTGGSFSLGRH
jgi:hypothetical protein